MHQKTLFLSKKFWGLNPTHSPAPSVLRQPFSKILITALSTGWPKTVGHKLLSYLCQVLSDSQNFFHWRILGKICNKVVTKHTITP